MPKQRFEIEDSYDEVQVNFGKKDEYGYSPDYVFFRENEDPFCCGIGVLGDFEDSDNNEVAHEAAVKGIRQRCSSTEHSILQASVVSGQEMWKRALIECGFQVQSTFTNRKTGRRVWHLTKKIIRRKK